MPTRTPMRASLSRQPQTSPLVAATDSQPQSSIAPAVIVGMGANQSGSTLGEHLGIVNDTRGGGKKAEASKGKR